MIDAVATPATMEPVFGRLGISGEVWCGLVKDFGRMFYAVAGRPHEINAHRFRNGQRRYKTKREANSIKPVKDGKCLSFFLATKEDSNAVSEDAQSQDQDQQKFPRLSTERKEAEQCLSLFISMHGSGQIAPRVSESQ